MSCEHPLLLLGAFVDDELAPSDRYMLEIHCAQCLSCRGHLEQLMAVRSVLRQKEVRHRSPQLLRSSVSVRLNRDT